LSEAELGDSKIGTTKQGIGPCFADKVNRKGLRVSDLEDLPSLITEIEKLLSGHRKRFPNSNELAQVDAKTEANRLHELYQKRLKPFVVDTIYFLNNLHAKGSTILLEGANATMLDIDFGTYPYVTSSSTTISGASTGLGLSPDKIQCPIGIVKAYTTRVGGGPFPTELLDKTGEEMRRIGGEFGTTTGRPRRCGWLDLVVLKYTHLINGYKYINLTKIDVLTGFPKLKVAVNYKIDGKLIEGFPGSLNELSRVEVDYIEVDGWTEDISTCRKFEDLPANCAKYIKMVEESVGVPVKWIGVGPARSQMIERNI
jgi:adenylosuccinate synthase